MITAKIGTQTYVTELSAGHHHFKADEPTDNGGKDLGPTPTQYLCSALASCMLITLRMYVNRKEWEVNSIEANIEKSTMEDGSSLFEGKVIVDGNLDEKQLQRVEKIAHLCPIHKVLERGNEIKVDVVLAN